MPSSITFLSAPIMNTDPSTCKNNFIDSKTSIAFSGIHLSKSSTKTTSLPFSPIYSLMRFLNSSSNSPISPSVSSGISSGFLRKVPTRESTTCDVREGRGKREDSAAFPSPSQFTLLTKFPTSILRDSLILSSFCILLKTALMRATRKS